jgi:hypothetical protein
LPRWSALAFSPLQRRRQFAEADRAVAIGIEFVEDVVGLRGVGAAGAERVFEFRFADRAVAIGIDLREQVLQRTPTGWSLPTVDPDDWPCAASSALMVAGDICEPPPVNPVAGSNFPKPRSAGRPNGSLEPSPKPVDAGEDELDEVSDWIASIAVDAAPSANNMAELQPMPHRAARPTRRWISKRRAIAKKPINTGFLLFGWPGTPAIDAVAAEFSAFAA